MAPLVTTIEPINLEPYLRDNKYDRPARINAGPIPIEMNSSTLGPMSNPSMSIGEACARKLNSDKISATNNINQARLAPPTHFSIATDIIFSIQ